MWFLLTLKEVRSYEEFIFCIFSKYIKWDFRCYFSLFKALKRTHQNTQYTRVKIIIRKVRIMPHRQICATRMGWMTPAAGQAPSCHNEVLLPVPTFDFHARINPPTRQTTSRCAWHFSSEQTLAFGSQLGKYTDVFQPRRSASSEFVLPGGKAKREFKGRPAALLGPSRVTAPELDTASPNHFFFFFFKVITQETKMAH